MSGVNLSWLSISWVVHAPWRGRMQKWLVMDQVMAGRVAEPICSGALWSHLGVLCLSGWKAPRVAALHSGLVAFPSRQCPPFILSSAQFRVVCHPTPIPVKGYPICQFSEIFLVLVSPFSLPDPTATSTARTHRIQRIAKYTLESIGIILLLFDGSAVVQSREKKT
jgi:hypothetical protein